MSKDDVRMKTNYGGQVTAKELVIQTRVDADQLELIQAAARAHALPLAAYLRKVILVDALGTQISCWITDFGHDPGEWLARGVPPHYTLRRTATGGAGEQTFIMLHPPGRHHLTPVSEAFLRELDIFRKPAMKQLVLEGSSARWILVRTTFSGTAGTTEIVVRPEGTPSDTVRARIHSARGGKLTFDLVGGGSVTGTVNAWDAGMSSFELKLESGAMRTMHYDRVVAVG